MTDASSYARGAVLIAGASTGIGEACAMRLDAMDFQVFAGIRKDSDAERLRAKASPRLTPVRIDVTDLRPAILQILPMQHSRFMEEPCPIR